MIMRASIHIGSRSIVCASMKCRCCSHPLYGHWRYSDPEKPWAARAMAGERACGPELSEFYVFVREKA